MSAFEDFGVTVATVEQNGFQNWLVQELQKLSLTAGRVFGHNTGLERSSLDLGIPVLAVRLDAGLWTVPSGDLDSRMHAAAWQDELEAFGWVMDTSGRSVSTMALSTPWFVERAIAYLKDRAKGPDEATIYAEDLGIHRVKIGEDY